MPVSIMKAQAYTMTNGQTIYVCSSALLDSGGSANYANSANMNYTLCSSSAGQCLQHSFGAFALETGWDFLRFYDGNSAASALIGTYSGGVLPPVITSTGGCLFFVFTSNGSITRAMQYTLRCRARSSV
jgi:hypothetical protein